MANPVGFSKQFDILKLKDILVLYKLFYSVLDQIISR